MSYKYIREEWALCLDWDVICLFEVSSITLACILGTHSPVGHFAPSFAMEPTGNCAGTAGTTAVPPTCEWHTIHHWPRNQDMSVHNWCPYLYSRPEYPWPPHITARPGQLTSVAKDLGDGLQCIQMLHNAHPPSQRHTDTSLPAMWDITVLYYQWESPVSSHPARFQKDSIHWPGGVQGSQETWLY